MCSTISGVEPGPPPSRLASWHLGVRWTRRGLLSHHQTFPLHRDTELQPCGTTSHQLQVGDAVINLTYQVDTSFKACLQIYQNLSFFSFRTHTDCWFLSLPAFHSFCAFHSDTKKPLHRECGFIRMQPGTNRVAFIIAQNSGSQVTGSCSSYLLTRFHALHVYPDIFFFTIFT